MFSIRLGNSSIQIWFGIERANLAKQWAVELLFLPILETVSGLLNTNSPLETGLCR
jgi:hypothetical protein